MGNAAGRHSPSRFLVFSLSVACKTSSSESRRSSSCRSRYRPAVRHRDSLSVADVTNGLASKITSQRPSQLRQCRSLWLANTRRIDRGRLQRLKDENPALTNKPSSVCNPNQRIEVSPSVPIMSEHRICASSGQVGFPLIAAFCASYLFIHGSAKRAQAVTQPLTVLAGTYLIQAIVQFIGFTNDRCMRAVWAPPVLFFAKVDLIPWPYLTESADETFSCSFPYTISARPNCSCNELFSQSDSSCEQANESLKCSCSAGRYRSLACAHIMGTCQQKTVRPSLPQPQPRSTLHGAT